MKKGTTLSILFLVFIVHYSVLGQTDSTHRIDSQLMVKSNVWRGTYFYTANREYNWREASIYLSNHKEASAIFAKAKTNHVWSQMLGGIGGFMAGYPMGTALGGGQPNWSLAAIGGGMILLGLPFNAAAGKHAKEAVSLYNNGIRQSQRHSRFHSDIHFACSPKGFVIRCVF